MTFKSMASQPYGKSMRQNTDAVAKGQIKLEAKNEARTNI